MTRPRPLPSRLLSLTALACIGSCATAQVDWTHCQSPVKHQGNRGTCAAFAVCSALETFPGIPCDLSEQLLYATLKLHQNGVVGWSQKLGKPMELREGDSMRAYIGLFELLGTCAETFLPYDPDPRRAGPGVPDELKRYLELAHVPPEELDRIRDGFGKYGFAAADCTLLDQQAVRDLGKLKALLDSSVLAIPVGYHLHPGNWSNLRETGNAGADGRRLIVHPGMMDRFRRGSGAWLGYDEAKAACMQGGEDLVAGLAKGAWTREPVATAKEYAGHAVLLVGYDDRGFIAKNSWGTEWGDGGYCRIAFDYHSLYAGEGLVLRGARIRNPALSPFETSKRIKEGRFRLKVQPRGRGDEAHLVLSLWMLEPRDAAFERVEYTITGPGKDQEWRLLVKETADAGSTDRRTGAPLRLERSAMAAIRASESLKLSVQVGVRASTDAGNLAASQWLRTLEFGALPREPRSAVDLEPVR